MLIVRRLLRYNLVGDQVLISAIGDILVKVSCLCVCDLLVCLSGILASVVGRTGWSTKGYHSPAVDFQPAELHERD
jgi:hypothetical protein